MYLCMYVCIVQVIHLQLQTVTIKTSGVSYWIYSTLSLILPGIIYQVQYVTATNVYPSAYYLDRPFRATGVSGGAGICSCLSMTAALGEILL